MLAMRYCRVLLPVAALILFTCGCAGHFHVRRVPPALQATAEGDKIEGFRYFLPKPYLLVTNMTVLPATAPGSESQAGHPASGSKPEPAKDSNESGSSKESCVISVQLIWLPDSKQEYAVSVEGGRMGTFKGALQLTSGWMLVAVNEEFDSKTVEAITALSGSLGTLFAASGLPVAAKAAAPTAKCTGTPFLYLFEIDMANQRLVEVESQRLMEALKKAQ